jgi:hypothetical protein
MSDDPRVSTGDFTMHTPRRKIAAKAARLLGAAGLLSLAGGVSAATCAVANLPTQTTAPNHKIILYEEELSDVSLSTLNPTIKTRPRFR